MSIVEVKVSGGSYEVKVEMNCLSTLAKEISDLGLRDRKVAIITDTNVAGHYLKKVETLLMDEGIDYSYHVVSAGESSKNMQEVENISKQMIDEGHDRHSFVVALGGGVVGDLAGFVASIFYRGIPYIQIPTTIVSQVDSSVGGKTGVNTSQGKNLIGSFHHPLLVLVDPNLLITLPRREYLEGFAEVIKHAAIRDEGMLKDLEEMDVSVVPPPEELLARNIQIKADIVAQDEKETTGTRALLNFGHTIGHAIEASVPYGELLHGEAVSLGMRAALFLSVYYRGLPQDEADRIIDLLDKFSLPLVLSEGISIDTVFEKIKTDKKFQRGKLNFVLLKKIGDASLVGGLREDHVDAAIKVIKSPLDALIEINLESDEEDYTFLRYEGGPLATNGYIINTGTEILAIDAPEGFYDLVAERNIKVDALLITHQHFDHIIDAHKFSEAGIPVYAYQEFTEGLVLAEIMDEFSIDIEIKPFDVAEKLKGKDVLKVNESTICPIYVPGHSPDSIAYYLPGKLVLFSGDTLYLEGIGRTDFEGGDEQLLFNSIRDQLMTMSASVQVFPGHGEETTIAHERRLNPEFKGLDIKNSAKILTRGAGPNPSARKIFGNQL